MTAALVYGICATCGGTFVKNSHRHKFCSTTCKHEAHSGYASTAAKAKRDFTHYENDPKLSDVDRAFAGRCAEEVMI